MSKPLLLDLFCGAGGAAMGYHRAGFDIVGVDHKPQPRFPFEFIQADAMTFPLDGFDVIHASPPCQAHSSTRSLWKRPHADLIDPTRQRLVDADKPFIIENVVGAPLLTVFELCGATFGLKMYRHRLFESSELILAPPHLPHRVRCAPLGRAPQNGEFWTIAGHVPNVRGATEAMGTPWMIQREVAQAIPPAYTEYIGRQLMRAL